VSAIVAGSSRSGRANTKATSTAAIAKAERRNSTQSVIIPRAFMPMTRARLSGLARMSRPQAR